MRPVEPEAAHPGPQPVGERQPENPDAAEGDNLIWKLSNRPDAPEQHPLGADGIIRVEGYNGTPLCVDVLIVRKGKTSDPLTACYPPSGGEG